MAILRKKVTAAKSARSSSSAKASKPAQAVPRAKVQEDPRNKYGFCTSEFTPPDKPGTVYPMANICRRNSDGQLNEEARVVSLSKNKARLILEFIDEIREWAEEQD